MTQEALRSGRAVALDELRVGELLAEGGEGRVYELPLQPHLVYKSYRRQVPGNHLEELVAWPGGLHEELRPRLHAAAAWPAAVVKDRGTAVGLLLPRAPRRFALRHRDGTTRLASLSYLTADPAHRAVAYGLHLPPEASPERFGLVYALARLLEAFESGSPNVAHGDLSAKNVLWSLQRGPEVFVIDCDNSERFDAGGEPVDHSGRRRAMTPNWEDPAVPAGQNPGPDSDRYSLALITLRVVGAANFPIQARQRAERPVSVDFALSPRLLVHAELAPGAPIWELCRRGLAVSAPSARPAAGEWVRVLEQLLEGLGASGVAESVRDTQGGGRWAAAPNGESSPVPSDVTIRPVARAMRRPEPRITRVPLRPSGTGGFRSVPVGQPKAPSPTKGPADDRGEPVRAQFVAGVRQLMQWWVMAHQRAAAGVTTSGRRGKGLRSVIFCLAVDTAVLVAGFFFVAMIVAPMSGI